VDSGCENGMAGHVRGWPGVATVILPGEPGMSP
jgi:hypothetical protein